MLVEDLDNGIKHFFEERITQLYIDNKFEEADEMKLLRDDVVSKIDSYTIKIELDNYYDDGYADGRCDAYEEGYEAGYNHGQVDS